MLKKGGVRAGYYLPTAPKFVCLVEGSAIALLADPELKNVRTVKMQAPCLLRIQANEALSFIPASDGEIVEYVSLPHSQVISETKKVDFGDHLKKALERL